MVDAASLIYENTQAREGEQMRGNCKQTDNRENRRHARLCRKGVCGVDGRDE